MSKEHRISGLAEVLELSPEEFERFLPDLVVWYLFVKANPECKSDGMTWIDDGKPGQISGVELTVAETGETSFIANPDFK